MMYRLLLNWWRRSPRRKPLCSQPFAALEACEPRALLSGVTVVASTLPAVAGTTSQSDLGILAFDSVTGQWTAQRYDGTAFGTETIAEWKSTVPDRPTVFGDVWGLGQKDIIHYDSDTGRLIANWQAGSSISSGSIAGWSAGMDLKHFTSRDLNRDGRADFLGYNRLTGKWALSLSAPGNQYTSRNIGTWDKSVDWQSVSFADFDGDGVEDIAGYAPGPGRWSLLLGNAVGSYAPVTLPTTGSGKTVTQRLIANFDGTPGAEILEWDSSTGNWSATSYAGRVFKSSGVGQWNKNANWTDFVKGDFWGLGREAVAARSETTGEWWITWSVGSGVSTSRLKSWAPGTYADTIAADLNNDGRTDILSRNVATGVWYQLLTLPGGAVSTIPVTTTSPGYLYDNLQVADLNQDGKPEILAHRTGTATWDVLVSRAAAGFDVVRYTSSETQFRPTDFATGDFNRDGRIDLMTRDSGTWNWHAFSLSGSIVNANRWNTWNAFAQSWDQPQSIDFDGDGDNDLVGRDTRTGDWWLADFEGSRSQVRKIANWNSSVTWDNVRTIDFDGNGTRDLIGMNRETGDWHWLRNYNGVVSSSLIGRWDLTGEWIDIFVVDMFGTGSEILVGRNPSTGRWWGIWKTPNGTSSRLLTTFNPSGNYVDTTLVDFNGDGKQALVTRDANSGNWYTIQFIANNFRTSQIGNWKREGDWKNLFVADLDGNGSEALYGRNQVTGQLVEIASNAGGFAQRTIWTILPRETLDLTAVAKTVGNTFATIYVRSSLTRNWFQLTFDSLGVASFTSIGLWESTTDWTSLKVGDLNRDGRDDLVGTGSSGNWSWMSFNGTTWTPASGGSALLPTGWTSYALTDIPGVSNRTLRATIIADSPGLMEALTRNDPLEIATLVRNWVANNTNFSFFSELLDRQSRTIADDFFVTFAANSAGASCGGYGFLMASTLALFDIEALIVSFGDLNAGITHTTTLLPVNNEGQYEFYLVDATFNMTLVDPESGNPLSYMEAVDIVLSENSADNIAVEQGNLAARRFISTSNRSSLPGVFLNGVTSSGVYVHSWSSYGLDDYVVSINPSLSAFGYSAGYAGFFELMPHVIEANSIAGSSQKSVQALLAFRSQLAARGLSIG